MSGAVTLPTIDGTKGNILANHYSKITYINPESVLAKYLAPAEYNTASQEADEHPVIMPFGINKSQYEAVKRAIQNQISIIEGPPGTGKTQTILNVIANMLIRGKTVAVVSSNNAAVVNVKEKLDAAELGYTAAYLGSSNNKEAFIRSQENVNDDLYSWRISPKEKEASSNAIRTGVEKSLESLEIETTLAIKRQELSDLDAEIQQFEKSGDGAVVSDRFETKDDILTFMAEWERVSTSKGFISKVKCAAGFIARYKWFGIRTLVKGKSQDAESLQRSYYKIAKENLTAEISRLEAELESSSLKYQIKRLSINSFFLLKGILANQYCTEKERRKYTLEDLWKKPNEFVSDYPVILSTTFSLRTSLNSKIAYDCLIVDEASQVDLVTGALAMSCCAKKNNYSR